MFQFASRRRQCSFRSPSFILLIGVIALGMIDPEARAWDQPVGQSPDLLAELKAYPNKIVFETNRDGNWELYTVNADGSNPTNLTRTPNVGELYPRPSPDGTKICLCPDGGS